jgi:FKBP-type peptidyl-prolyl cis-trans isomerase FklB
LKPQTKFFMQRLKTAAFLLGILLVSSTVNAQQQMDSLSYSLGVLLAENLKQQGFDELDEASLTMAIKDVMSGEATQISVQDANVFVQRYMQKKQETKFAGAKQAGEAFLKENAQREEVTVLPSGLQYEVLEPGSGEKPSADSKVKVHYHGTLVDGTVFDSSVERDQPATFGVNQVISGWTEALQLMPEGAKWKLYIPADLAYGERGAGQKIGPYATLIFEVELLEIM